MNSSLLGTSNNKEQIENTVRSTLQNMILNGKIQKYGFDIIPNNDSFDIDLKLIPSFVPQYISTTFILSQEMEISSATINILLGI